jgi:hypothetical protein
MKPKGKDEFHAALLDSIDFSDWPHNLAVFLRTAWPGAPHKELRLEQLLSFRYEATSGGQHPTSDLFVAIAQDDEADEWKRRLRTDPRDERHTDLYHVVIRPRSVQPEDHGYTIGFSIICKNYRVRTIG